MASVSEPFKRLVKLTARAFYSEDAPSKSSQSKSKVDNRGSAVVILDALTRRAGGWVKEEDLAKDLKLHPKQLRRVLKVLEEHQLVNRDSRKEVVRPGGVVKEVVVNEDGVEGEEERTQRAKVHTLTYCSLDYPKLYDIVRYRVHRAKKRVKDELEDRNTVQEYYCPDANCGRRYTAFDAMHLLNPMSGLFHCEKCNTEVLAEGENAAEDLGEGNERRKRREVLKDNLQKMEKQLKPLVDQLTKVKDLNVPDFGTLHQWEQQRGQRAAAAAAGEFVYDIQLPGMGRGPGSSSYGDAKVEVDLSGLGGAGGKSGGANGAAPAKAIPFFLLNSSAEAKAAEAEASAKEEVKAEVKEEVGGSGGSVPAFTVKKEEPVEDDNEAEQKRLYEAEFMKAYYAAMLASQSGAAGGEAAAGASAGVAAAADTAEATAVRVKEEQGMDTGAEEEEDIEWEDADMDGEGEMEGQVGGTVTDAANGNTENMDDWWEGDEVDGKDYDTD